MSGSALVLQQRQHLGHLLEAIQRCAYFLETSAVDMATSVGVIPATDSFAAEFEGATANGQG